MVGTKIQKYANESIQRTKDQRVVNMLMKQHIQIHSFSHLYTTDLTPWAGTISTRGTWLKSTIGDATKQIYRLYTHLVDSDIFPTLAYVKHVTTGLGHFFTPES